MNDRILTIHDTDISGDHVVYLMSRDQRTQDNHALLAAQELALEHKLPLVVVFNLHSKIGERAYEHAEFMLKGLEEVAENLAKKDIHFLLTTDDILEKTLQSLNPAALYADFSPLKGPRQRIKELAKTLGCATYVVDTHNIIPVWKASEKQEFAAHTFRRKVHAHLEHFLQAPGELQKHPHTSNSLPPTLDFSEGYDFIKKHYPVRHITLAAEPGEKAAAKALADFIDNRLENYSAARNNIAQDGQSQLSPYLHFGQLASLRIALEVLYTVDARPLLFDEPKMANDNGKPTADTGMNALYEEMIVRKELSDNFCFYSNDYKSLAGAPDWAKKTLAEHANDPREHSYSFEQLEKGETHDTIWNAAQQELTNTGKLHGYLRMYWAKKILEWTDSAEQALEFTIILNDRYSIDGGDPNGYVGILWSIGGLHDRPWAEREIFGKIRYMNAGGLRRKFDVDAYVARVTQNSLV